MLQNTQKPRSKKYILNINENTITDLNSVDVKNRKRVKEIIEYKKQQLKVPKTYLVNGIKVNDTGSKINKLLSELIKKNPDLAYTNKINLYQIGLIKYILALSGLIGAAYCYGFYLVYMLFINTYNLPKLSLIFTLVVGAISGLATYELVLLKKEEGLKSLMIKGVVLDPEKEIKQQRIYFLLQIFYTTPALALMLFIVQYAILLALN